MMTMMLKEIIGVSKVILTLSNLGSTTLLSLVSRPIRWSVKVDF